MRAFAKKDFRGEYRTINFAVAADGFRQMGWETVGYESIRDILDEVTPEDIVIGYIGDVDAALQHLGFEVPTLDTYPPSLSKFLGRKVWTSTIDTVASAVDSWPVFVKPISEKKKFTGVLVRGTADLIGCGDSTSDTSVWCVDPINFLHEWRVFIRYGEIIGVKSYQGDWRISFDPKIIEEAVEAWIEKPAGCSLDFGVDDKGRTLVVEANDGYALGSYGLDPIAYAKLISARWSQLTSTRDLCAFDLNRKKSIRS